MQHEIQHKKINPCKYKDFTMRVTGLEPARRGHQNLNLARLPIPPHPPMNDKESNSFFTLIEKI